METIYDDIFDFKGAWGIPSKCQLMVVKDEDKYVVIATEIYKGNPGSTVTDVAASLAMQVCEKFSIPYDKLVYAEHNPETKTKLSFYEQEFFQVTFSINDAGELCDPKYKQVIKQDIFM
ncbi:MAG: hypothetical protein J6X26_02010 [Bacteroidales bacterium]|nr:hypothetical protein [Bacteroidales bacterium]